MAALVAALRVCGVAPGADTVPVRVPAVVPLQIPGQREKDIVSNEPAAVNRQVQ